MQCRNAVGPFQANEICSKARSARLLEKGRVECSLIYLLWLKQCSARKESVLGDSSETPWVVN